MRLPSFPTLIRTFYTISNTTTSRFFNPKAPLQTLASSPLNRGGVIGFKSMPTVPFLSSLFSTSAQSKQMADYPVKKSDDEWRAVLNKGIYQPSFHLLPSPPPPLSSPNMQIPTIHLIQNNSVSSVPAEPKHPSPAPTTNTRPLPAPTAAPPAPRPCTAQRTSSNPDAGGRRTLTAFRVP